MLAVHAGCLICLRNVPRKQALEVAWGATRGHTAWKEHLSECTLCSFSHSVQVKSYWMWNLSQLWEEMLLIRAMMCRLVAYNTWCRLVIFSFHVSLTFSCCVHLGCPGLWSFAPRICTWKLPGESRLKLLGCHHHDDHVMRIMRSRAFTLSALSTDWVLERWHMMARMEFLVMLSP